MRIPDEIMKCVAFIACQRNSGLQIGGTAFFVEYPLAAKEKARQVYLVTAKHVIDETNAADGIVYCRVNMRSGQHRLLEISALNWISSNRSGVDVAVVPVSFDDSFDHVPLPLSMFMTPKNPAAGLVGVGDDLFFPGLFTKRAGNRSNLPIARIGNIAAMPEESVESDRFGILEPPYLVEARSFGGFSGSPVFWNGTVTRFILPSSADGPMMFLLGLVHGHFNEMGRVFDNSQAAVSDAINVSALNMGIAIVVPALDILSVLDQPDLKEQRDAKCRRLVAAKKIDSTGR